MLSPKILSTWISVSLVKLAETPSSDDDDDSDKEGDDQDDDSENDDDDDSNGSQDLSEQLSQLAVEQPELGELENSDDQEPDRMKIHEWVLQTEGILMSHGCIDQKNTHLIQSIIWSLQVMILHLILR